MKKGYIYTTSLALMLALGFSKNGLSQNIGINTSGATPDASAGLDISFTDKGLLIPRVNITNLNLASPITSPAISLLVYNTNTTTGLGYYYWDGSKWVSLNSNDWKVTGNAGTNTTNNFLGTTDNQALVFRTNNTERMRLLTDGKVVVNATAHPYNDQLVAYGTANWGVAGYNTGTGGGSVYGENSSASSGYATIEGVNNYNGTTYTPAAVNGIALSTILTHRAIGVKGAANGRDGIGVMGSIQVAQTATNRSYGWAGYFAGDVFTTGGFYTPSDSRLKKNVTNYTGALHLLSQLNVVSYYFDLEKFPNSGFSNKKEIGFIAQELLEVFPTAVSEKIVSMSSNNKPIGPKEQSNLDFQKFYTVDYTRLVPVAIEAIKEQQQIIESQNAKIERLEKAIEELKELIKK